MRPILLVLFLCVTLYSCKSKEPKINEVIKYEYVDRKVPPVDDFSYDALQGMYTGDFAGSEMRIILNYVSGTNVIGYNIHKGLQRNINGKLTKNGDSITMTLPEPGDHKFDGVFELIFIGINKNPSGKWTSNSGEISEKNFNLKKLEAPKGDQKGINSTNFTEYFGYVHDTLGSYTFEPDGFCLYEYYPKTDESNRVEQLKEIKGNWSLSDSTVTVDWQQNSVFTESKMTFKVTKAEYGEYYLKGKDRTLYYYYY